MPRTKNKEKGAKGLRIVENAGVYYLTLRQSGIHPIVVMTDGIPISIWDGGKKPYLALDDVIAWYDKEGSPRHTKIADNLRDLRGRLLGQAANGEGKT